VFQFVIPPIRGCQHTIIEHIRIICYRFWNLDHYDDSMRIIILSVSEQCHFDECCYSECCGVNKRTHSFKDGISSLKPNQKNDITDIMINLIQTSQGGLKGEFNCPEPHFGARSFCLRGILSNT
jgi:hypothetical protein